MKTTSKEAILKQAHSSSLGVFVDDPKGITSLNNVFVDFYNGLSKATISRGRETIGSCLVFKCHSLGNWQVSLICSVIAVYDI